MTRSLRTPSTTNVATPTPARTGRRWVLWGLSGALLLILVALITLAFKTSSDTDANSGVAASGLSSTSNTDSANQVSPEADSGPVAGEIPPPMPAIIAGQEVDAHGNSVNPNMVHAGDDSAFLHDEKDTTGNNENDKNGGENTQSAR